VATTDSVATKDPALKAGKTDSVATKDPALKAEPTSELAKDLEPDSKDNYRASRLTAIWMQANVTKAARVPARFS
jgi:hypothetical protein